MQYLCTRKKILLSNFTNKEMPSEGKTNDEKLSEIIYEIRKEKWEDFTLAEDGTLMVGKRICVLDKENLKFKLLDEAPRTPYSVHPRAAKMYQDLMQHY